jgi:hypothetical protein
MPPPRAPGFLVLLLILAGAAGLLLLTAGAAAAAPAPASDGWRWPLRGEVVQRFAYSRAHAFAAGARRGIGVAGAPGARVGAACAGRVTFAGRLPAGGRGVTVRCGALLATHLGLGRVAVRRGATVLAGTRLGALGRSGTLRLGARRAADRFGYVDPLTLLGEAPGDGPVPAAPLGRAPQAPVAPAARPAASPARAPVRVPSRAAHPAARPLPSTPARIPPVAWAGLVVLAAGVPLGGLVHRDRRRRAGRALASDPSAPSPGWSRL